MAKNDKKPAPAETPNAATPENETESTPTLKPGLVLFELVTPNSCHNCGKGPLSQVYARNDQAAVAGKGLCEKCASN